MSEEKFLELIIEIKTHLTRVEEGQHSIEDRVSKLETKLDNLSERTSMIEDVAHNSSSKWDTIKSTITKALSWFFVPLLLALAMKLLGL